MKEIEDEMRLIQYIELKRQIKPMLLALQALSKQLKKRGSFSTEHYVCSVEKRTRQGMKSLSEVIKAKGITFVIENELLKVFQFKIISVTEKKIEASEKSTKDFLQDVVK